MAPSASMRFAAGAVVLLAAAYPIRAFVSSPESAWWALGGFAAAVALGWIRPGAGALAALAAAPLVPLLPYLNTGVPHGVLHLIVLSQAMPLLGRVAAGRRTIEPDAVAWCLLAVVVVAVASLASFEAAYRLVFPSTLAFAGDLHGQLSSYIFGPPGKQLENMIAAVTVFADGLLAWFVVTSALPAAGAMSIARVLAGTAVAVSSVGIIQAMTGFGLRGMWRLHDPGIVRINATYSDPNALAAYLVLTLPLACALAIVADRRTSRALWGIGALVQLAALVMTASRSGYAAAMAALCVLAVTALARGLVRHAHKPLLIRTLTAAAVLVVGAAALLAVVATHRDLRHRDQSSYVHTVGYTLNARAALDETLKGRVTIWRTAFEMFADEPLFGVGVGAIYRKFANYNHRLDGDLDTVGLSAHSTFLNVAAELGMAGLIAWLMVLVAVYGTVWGRSADAADVDRPSAWLRAAIGAGLTGFGLCMITGDRTVLREDVVLFCAASALAAALTRPPPRLPIVARRVALLVVLLVCASWPARALAEARSIDLARITWGFYDVEVDGDRQPFRWSSGSAALHVPAQADSVALPLRSLAPFPQTVAVHLDGRLVDTIHLADHNWRRLRYTLPQGRRSAFHRMELAVTPTWRPPDDPRQLGVAVRAWDLWIPQDVAYSRARLRSRALP